MRVILDTNILLRGFINLGSTSGRILIACQRRLVLPVLSRPVLTEYRAILRRPKILLRYPELENPRIADALERLLYVGEYHRRVSARFAFDRDPKDEHLLELAIATSASHLITADKDMLSLVNGRDDAAKRFRRRTETRVQHPDDFVAGHRLG